MVRLVNTIASNATGLYKAREIIPGVLPVTADNGGQPVKWYEREPNDYGDFGADVEILLLDADRHPSLR